MKINRKNKLENKRIGGRKDGKEAGGNRVEEIKGNGNPRHFFLYSSDF